MNSNNKLDLEAIRARERATTPSPWTWEEDQNSFPILFGPNTDGSGIAFDRAEDGLFIAHARQDVPDLIAEVERLRRESERQEAEITERIQDSLDLHSLRSNIRSIPEFALYNTSRESFNHALFRFIGALQSENDTLSRRCEKSRKIDQQNTILARRCEVLEEEIESACSIICPLCSDGVLGVKRIERPGSPVLPFWIHVDQLEDEHGFSCKAFAVRERHWQNQQKEKGDES